MSGHNQGQFRLPTQSSSKSGPSAPGSPQLLPNGEGEKKIVIQAHAQCDTLRHRGHASYFTALQKETRGPVGELQTLNFEEGMDEEGSKSQRNSETDLN